MLWSQKCRARREDIRKNRPDTARPLMTVLRDNGAIGTLVVAILFAAGAYAILLLRPNVVSYRPNQAIPHDIVSRVDFVYPDKDRLKAKQDEARETFPRRYRAATGDPWAKLERTLVELPDRVQENSIGSLEPPIRDALDSGAITALLQFREPRNRDSYDRAVRDYVSSLRAHRDDIQGRKMPLVLVAEADRKEEIDSEKRTGLERLIHVEPEGNIPLSWTYTPGESRFEGIALNYARKFFTIALEAKIAKLTSVLLTPTHVYDEQATVEQQNMAVERVPPNAGHVYYKANMILVPRAKNVFDQKDWQLLRAENEAYHASLGDRAAIATRAGTAGLVLIVTAVLSAYIGTYQPRIIRNRSRAIAIACLLLAMLLLSQLAGIGSGQLYLFGTAPVVLCGMILALAYDRRFAIGVATILGLLVTHALNQGISYFLILFTGVVTACLLLDDVRNRSKIIEVGGLTALAMIAATAAVGGIDMDPLKFVGFNCLYAGAAGLVVGFVVSGILPSIEDAFKITTSMTLLEAADVSHPLLRRLAIEAPGTYSHSLQVATLAEAAAEAIGANSLLCRVASYYHDVGKINKADYFVENQPPGGQNRHINLTPNVSLLIIIGHVKDGVEMAKEYDIPATIVPFIQQHHGTTLVEFFYHRAKTEQQSDPTLPAISDTQYRYPGPNPRSREIAVVMIADAVESATRAMPEPTATRVEALVHELIMKRLLDGQFDECEITIRDLELIEKAMVKTILSVYHGRIAYPSTASIQTPPPTQSVRSA